VNAGVESLPAAAARPGATRRIEVLDHRDPAVAARILAVLRLAHVQEAALLGGDASERFTRTVADIQSGDQFHVGMLDGDDALVGALALGADDEPGQICIASLVVHPDHQRRGIARSLIDEARRRVDGAVLSVVTAAVNTPAVNLYESLGFVAYRRGTMEPGAVRVVKLRQPGD